MEKPKTYIQVIDRSNNLCTELKQFTPINNADTLGVVTFISEVDKMI